MSPMDMANSGRVNATPIQNRRVKSMSSWFGSATAEKVMGSSAMPHFGQLAEPSFTTSGCMGQVYCPPLGATASSFARAEPSIQPSGSSAKRSRHRAPQNQ